MFASIVIVFTSKIAVCLHPKQQQSNIKNNISVHLHQKLRFVFIEKNTMLTSKITGYLLHVPLLEKRKITSTFSFLICGSNISTENRTFREDEKCFQYVQNNRMFVYKVLVFYIQNSSMFTSKTTVQ